MAIHKYTVGQVLSSANLNNMNAERIMWIAQNQIRQLMDRDAKLSNGNVGFFAEAYIDSNGRKNSVDTGSTTATYSSGDEMYFAGTFTDEASGDSTHDPSSYSSPGNAFDDDSGTYASHDGSTNATTYLGKTFGAKTVDMVYVKSYSQADGAGGSGMHVNSTSIKLQSYNGSTWSDEQTLDSDSGGAGTSSSADTYIIFNKSVQGLRVQNYSSNGGVSPEHRHRVYSLEYGDFDGSSVEVYHDIPSGTFGSAVSKAICVPFLENWESGANIQFKLTNTGGDDSGWLDCMDTEPIVSSFTAFSNGEPDTLIVKLIPKGSSPTPGYPAIKGVAAFAK